MLRKPNMPCTDIYASFDVETDGNNPIQHSLRSIGIALFVDRNTEPIDTFYVTVEPRKDTEVEDRCMTDFWDKHPEQWKEVNENTVTPTEAMKLLSDWLFSHSGKYCIKWVASPANFDWMFLKCYYENYGPQTKYDIGFFCHDLSSLTRAYIISHNIGDKKFFMNRLAGNCKYTHQALDDAVCQGVMYINLRQLLSESTSASGSMYGKPYTRKNLVH
jgi:DNA polymerase III alpha subunit (gram-positive type)